MDKIIKQISEGLANQSSRRGFFSTVGKATLGLATIIAGQGFFTENAAAQSELQCCTGTWCGTYGFTSHCKDTQTGYVWCCTSSKKGDHVPCDKTTTTCTDCFDTKQNGKLTYFCTLVK